MIIKFDDNTINNNYITSFKKKETLFSNGSFKLGSTTCVNITLQVAIQAFDGTGIEPVPAKVLIEDETYYVDSCDLTNGYYYEYELTDAMVKLNTPFIWEGESKPDLLTIFETIAKKVGLEAGSVPNFTLLTVDWDNTGDISCRDMVSYIAELNGSFAHIKNGVLELVPYNDGINTPITKININTCSDYTAGETVTIDRVVLELGTRTVKYPVDTEEEIEYKGVLYLNGDNVLYTDDNEYGNIEDMVKTIYDQMVGFSYCNFKTENCRIGTDRATPYLLFTNGSDLNYKTIGQIDLTYSGRWIGGYELDVDSTQQEETQVTTISQKAKSIKIKVDRELNKITQNVEDLESTVKHISANTVNKMVIQFAQVQGEIQPESWGTSITWNDEYTNLFRGETTYIDTSVFVSDSFVITKDEGKTVSKVIGLYQCSDGTAEPAPPTEAVTSGKEVYGEWTTSCPSYNSNYPDYYMCVQLNYTDGSYSWSEVEEAYGQNSLTALSSQVKTVVSEMSDIKQTSNSIELSVQEITETTIPNLDTRTQILETCVSVQADGLKVSQGSEGAYTLLTDDGMEIYSEGNKVAYARKDGFYAIDYVMNGWHMITANNKNSFCIVRKDYH